jgi:hypothetical protein
MKLKVARVLFVLLIWGLTSLATLKAMVLAWQGQWDRAKDVLRLQDRAAADAQWQEQLYTVSAQCGDGSPHVDCRLCRLVRRLMGVPHCNGARNIEVKGGA